MFIIYHISAKEVSNGAHMGTIDAFNYMHVGFQVRVEWKIGCQDQK